MSDFTYNNFTVETDRRGVTTVSMDVPDRPLNVLDAGVMVELEQIVAGIQSSACHRLVVFRSHKESGFLAGADVRRIAKISSIDEVHGLISRGQELFGRISRLPIPTVAVIHGPCLGGGLEWALACDYRLARDNSSTQIGLPEIKLGLIPGWGGTQRLPKTVGLRAALDMILSGRSLDAMAALRIGLVDRAIAPENWEPGIENFIDAILTGVTDLGRHAPRQWWQWCLDETGVGRRLVLAQARRQTASQREHYPAIEASLRAIAAGFDSNRDGYAMEQEQFAALISTPTCRNLLDLFFARESARNPKTWIAAAGKFAHDHPIRSIGVVGAGIMGAGIGQLAANRGFDVVIKEIDAQAAAAGQRRVADLFERQAKRKKWNPQRLEEMIAKVPVSSDPAVLDPVDLVIEAAVEQESIKQEIFKTLDRRTAPSTILASNTSSLSIASMASVTRRAAKVAGLHFFNPVYSMELVEVVAAPQTDEETVARLVTLVRALGKTPIVAKDSPGIVVNRVLFPYLGEAVRMISEGLDTAEIDAELRRFGMPMGPLELLDQVGIDVALHVANSLREVLPNAEAVVGPLAAMAEHERLGKKSGIGFYRYAQGRRGKAAALPAGVLRDSGISRASAGARATGGDSCATSIPDSLTPIQRRLVYPMLIEAVRCLELGIVAQGWAIDLAMVLGTGFAPHRGGPLHLIGAIGRDTLLANLAHLETLHGGRFAAPRLLTETSDFGTKILNQEHKGHEIQA